MLRHHGFFFLRITTFFCNFLCHHAIYSLKDFFPLKSYFYGVFGTSSKKYIFSKPCQSWEKYTEAYLYWFCVPALDGNQKHDIRLLPCFDALSFIILWKFPCYHVGGFSCFFFCFSKQWYVLYPHEGPWYELLVIPLRFELLCSIMIPISIKVSWW